MAFLSQRRSESLFVGYGRLLVGHRLPVTVALHEDLAGEQRACDLRALRSVSPDVRVAPGENRRVAVDACVQVVQRDGLHLGLPARRLLII